MNITDQILEDANMFLPFERSQIYSRAKILTGTDRIDFYKKIYSEKSKELCEKHEHKLQSFSPGRLTRFDYYSDLVDFFRPYFDPISTYKEIEFRDFENNTPAIGIKRQPVVKKGYNFARDHERGVSLSDFLKSLMLLNWIKGEIGFDVRQYPVKTNVVAFKNENTIFIFYKDYQNGYRLYYDANGNEEILKVYDEIIFREKSFTSMSPLIQELPFYEGDEAQYKFDIEWYKKRKQSPLSYRCFPTVQYMIITPDPNPDQCKHSGEYCIKKDEMDERFNRFLNVYNQLETGEKEELLLNTIDYFERFLKTDCFDLTIHKKPFDEILLRLNNMQKGVGIKENSITLNSFKPLSPKRFIDSLIGPDDNYKSNLLNFLFSDLKGKKGKDIAIMILALETNSLISYTKRAELFNAIRVDFGNIGTDAGINKYMPDPKCMDDLLKRKVELYAEKIKKHIENLPK